MVCAMHNNDAIMVPSATESATWRLGAVHFWVDISDAVERCRQLGFADADIVVDVILDIWVCHIPSSTTLVDAACCVLCRPI